jgi:hypothetical protein
MDLNFAAERQRLLTFAIVGGGPTGVEMAGAISEVARQSLAMDFRRIDPAAARIVLLEAGPRIMPTLPENLSDYARRTLAQKGGEVMTSSRVSAIVGRATIATVSSVVCVLRRLRTHELDGPRINQHGPKANFIRAAAVTVGLAAQQRRRCKY